MGLISEEARRMIGASEPPVRVEISRRDMRRTTVAGDAPTVAQQAAEQGCLVMAGHSRSKNGVAEPVIGPRFARTRWLAYVPAIPLMDAPAFALRATAGMVPS